MEDRLFLETPEQIELNYTIARLGSRFIAALWDTAAIAVIQIMLLVVFGVASWALDRLGVSLALGNWGAALFILLAFVLFWGYYIIFEIIWNGQTPGKRLASIRTVRQDGYPIGFTESAIRNIVRLADLLPGFYGLGVIVMFMDQKSRRLGDFAAGTLVVHDRPVASLEQLRPVTAQEAWLLDPALPRLERLTLDEVEATRRFLQRRGDLVNSEPLAARLATRFRERLELEDTNDDDVTLLRRIVAQYGR